MRTPTVVPAPSAGSVTPLPERVTIYEVGPRDGLQNEKGLVPTEVKAEFIRRLVAAGLPIVEATSFVHPKWVPQLADAAELLTMLGEAGREHSGAGAERARPRPSPRAGRQHIAIFGSATETFAQKNLNRSLDEQFAMFEPTVRRAREAGLDVRAYVSMCFGDPWEGAVPVEPGGRGRPAALRPRGQPAEPRRHDRGRHRRPRHRAGARLRRGRPRHRPARDALPRHLRPGARQQPCRAPVRHHDVRRQRGRAGRLSRTPRAPPATSPPRTSSGCCTASASRPGSTSSRSPRPAPGWPASSAGPHRRPWCAPSPGPRSPVRHNLAHESCRPPAHRCTQDRHDLSPGPPRPERPVAGRPRRAVPEPFAAGQPGALAVPGSARPAR